MTPCRPHDLSQSRPRVIYEADRLTHENNSHRYVDSVTSLWQITARASTRRIAAFDVANTGPSPAWSFNQTLPAAIHAVIAQTLSIPAYGFGR